MDEQELKKVVAEMHQMIFEMMAVRWQELGRWPQNDNEFLSYARNYCLYLQGKDEIQRASDRQLSDDEIMQALSSRKDIIETATRMANDLLPLWRQYSNAENIDKDLDTEDQMPVTRKRKEFKDPKEFKKQLFAFMQQYWEKYQYPANDEQFLGFAEKMTLLYLFFDETDLLDNKISVGRAIYELTDQLPNLINYAEQIAVDLLPQWHDVHWPRINFEEGQTHSATDESSVMKGLQKESSVMKGLQKESLKKPKLKKKTINR